MGSSYNPKVPTNGLVLYFDSKNPKSFVNNELIKNNIGSEYTTVTTNQDSDGFLIQTNVPQNNIDASFVPSSSSITVVASIKSGNNQGTIFQLKQGDNYYYIDSNLTSITTNTDISDIAFTTNSYNILYSNTGLTSITTNTDISDIAFTTNSYNILYSNTGLTSITTNTDISDIAFTTNSYNILYSDSSIVTLIEEVAEAGSSALSQEIFRDCPQFDVSAFIDGNNINILFKDTDKSLIFSNFVERNYNDIISIVYTKNSANSIKLYYNGEFIGQTGNVVLNNFGNTFSLFSRDSGGNMAQFPIRSVKVYNKELTQEEIQTISNALTI